MLWRLNEHGYEEEEEEEEDMGISVEEFEARTALTAEWLEYNRQEKISPGTAAIRPLPLKASKSKPHLVSPKTPPPLRASEAHSLKAGRSNSSSSSSSSSNSQQQQQQQQLTVAVVVAVGGGGGLWVGSARVVASSR
jgi:hypothetical protein